jgi:hypothetical protein
VPEGTKFEQRGFAPESAGPEETPLTAEQADALMGGSAMMADGTPSEPDPEGTETAEVSPEPAKKIKIGSREFDDTDQAWAYAQELEQEKIAADAFRHGVETASYTQQGNLPQAPAAPEELDPEFYTNPQEFLRKRDAKLLAQAEERVNAGISMKERNAQTWSSFYKDYPDLANAGRLVQMALNENFDRLKHVQLPIALKEIAEKARQMKKEIIESELPGKTMPTVKAGASAGKGSGVTPKAAPEQALSFTQQMKNMRKNKTAKMRR